MRRKPLAAVAPALLLATSVVRAGADEALTRVGQPPDRPDPRAAPEGAEPAPRGGISEVGAGLRRSVRETREEAAEARTAIQQLRRGRP